MTIEELPSSFRCPDCGTWLPEAATTCPSCGRIRSLPIADVAGRSVSSRALIVGAGAAALLAVGILIGWTIGPPSGWGPSPSPALGSAVAQTSASSSVASTPRPSDPDALTRRHRAGSIRFSLTVGAGWESFGPEYPNYITKSATGGQGAEALIYWTNVPRGGLPVLAESCYYLRTQRAGHSAADLAAVVAAAPGTDLITGPSQVTLGGYPAQHVALIVREDVGCDPGFFFTYPNAYGGALWPETSPRDTIRVWIIDVEGDLLFIAGATKPAAGAALEQDIDDIVQSIRFE